MARDAVLPDEQVTARLSDHPAWSVQDGKLHRELELVDFGAAFALMTRVALAAEKLDHHPDWSNSWNRVVIDVVNHAAGGITDRCFALVDAIDRAAG